MIVNSHENKDYMFMPFISVLVYKWWNLLKLFMKISQVNTSLFNYNRLMYVKMDWCMLKC